MKKTVLSLLSVAFLGFATLVSCNGGSNTSNPSSNAGTSSTPAETKKLVISGDSSIYVSGSTTLSVKVDGKNISADITWKSSDENIATVNSNGKVTAVAAGSVTITASATGYESGTFSITVKSNKQPLTIAVNASFTDDSAISAVADGYAIFFASPIGSETSDWVCHQLTLNSETNLWEYTFEEEVEFDQTISFNTYYSAIGSNGYGLINNESVSNAARSLEIVEGTTSYTINSTFTVPSTIDSITFTFTVVMNDGSALGEKVYLWYASSNNSWAPELCTKNDDGTFSITETDVPMSKGEVNTYCYQLLLGSATSYENWSYKWTDHEGDFYPTINSDAASDTSITNVTVHFDAQPDYSAETYAVAFTLNCTDVSGDAQIVIDGNSWNKMTWVEDGKYTFTASLAAGTHTYYFYCWNNVDFKMFADSSSTPFSIDVSADSAVSVTGTFASAIGTIDA